MSLGAVSQFIHMLEFNLQNAIRINLTDLPHASADDVLAQEHTQHRRFQRIGALRVCQIARAQPALAESKRRMFSP